MFNGFFVVFFGCLSFLGNRCRFRFFHFFFMNLFGCLRFLGNRRCFFFFHCFFMVLFRSLRFLHGRFFVFFVVHSLRSRCCGSGSRGGCRCSGVGDGVSSECSRRETHCSGNNQS
ncbi:hypothetical protein BZY71_06480 [Leclercia adecarboxylata]|nr:hypothetical protein BZY71_06480 [Leclercia adecarboxylata]